MLTAEGCRQRRQRLWRRPEIPADVDRLVLADPTHLRYLANFFVDPISLGADFGGLLVLCRDGIATLFHDNRLPRSVERAHIDERRVVPWYDGQSPGRGPRQMVLNDLLQASAVGGRIHDRLGHPLAPAVTVALADLRRAKDADELDCLRRCMRATEAGHAWAREHVRPGLTELDIYSGISAACVRVAGQPAVVYGDFAVCTGPERRGGPPTDRVLRPGDMLILDYSVVLDGYRSDFTNTLVVGREPSPEQQRLYDLCMQAMAAGEHHLRAGVECRTVYDAVRDVFARAGMADHFPHHAGHGLGLTHPEAPFIVRHADETLRVGDVVTLEPGLYVRGAGGIRIEHNYRIGEQGFERLSRHTIALK